MRLFPQKEFEIQTEYSIDEVRDRLNNATIHPHDNLKTKLFVRDKRFKGEIDEQNFELIPRGLMYGSHQLRPIIKGTIAQEDNEVKLKGQAASSPELKFIFILMPIMIIFMSVVTLLSSTAFDKSAVIVVSLVVICVLNFIIFHWIFKLNAKRYINLLEKIINGNTEQYI